MPTPRPSPLERKARIASLAIGYTVLEPAMAIRGVWLCCWAAVGWSEARARVLAVRALRTTAAGALRVEGVHRPAMRFRLVTVTVAPGLRHSVNFRLAPGLGFGAGGTARGVGMVAMDQPGSHANPIQATSDASCAGVLGYPLLCPLTCFVRAMAWIW